MDKDKRREIIESYTGLVDVVVDSLLSTSKFNTFKYLREDLKAEGYVHLIEAIDRYDPKRKVKPVSYFSLRIRGGIKNYIRDLVEEVTPLRDIEDIGFEIADEREEYNEDWVGFVDKHEPEEEIDRRIYHEILMGGTTPRELADELGLSRNAIKMKTKRLKKKLKIQIEREENK